MEAEATTGRTSSRVKIKSQRAVESEHTDRLIARAKEKAKMERQGSAAVSDTSGVEAAAVASPAALGQDGETASGPQAQEAGIEDEVKRSKTGARKKGAASAADAAASKSKSRGRPKKVWCVCKTTDPGAMIECEACNDWFHFQCVNLSDEEADRIHTYICPPCSERTGLETKHNFDISTFRSPSPHLGDTAVAEPPAKSNKRSKAKPADGQGSRRAQSGTAASSEPAIDAEQHDDGDEGGEGAADDPATSDDGSEDANIEPEDDDDDEDAQEGSGGESDSGSDHHPGSDTEPATSARARDRKRKSKLSATTSKLAPRTSGRPGMSARRGSSTVFAAQTSTSTPGRAVPSASQVTSARPPSSTGFGRKPSTSAIPPPPAGVRRTSSTATASAAAAKGRKPSSSVAGSSVGAAASGQMTSARQFVLDKLTPLLGALFGSRKTADEVRMYATELESALFREYKEVKDGKPVTSARYKTQFTILQSSLNPSLQTGTLSALLSSSLTPSELAVLPSAKLASQARYEQIQAAEAEILRQTVRVSAKDADGGVRIGRDGFEKVEDAKEKELEMVREREQQRKREEERARKEREREEEERYGVSFSSTQKAEKEADRSASAGQQETYAAASPVKPTNAAGAATLLGQGQRSSSGQVLRNTVDPEGSATPSEAPAGPEARTGDSATPLASPLAATVPLKRKASESVLESPTKDPLHKRASFDLRSAWSGGATTDVSSAAPHDVGVDSEVFGVDQSAIDLSDFMAENGTSGDIDMDDPIAALDAEEEARKRAEEESERYKAKPIVWSGRLTNPFEPSPHLPPTQIRLLAPTSRPIPPAQWNLFFPNEVLATENRVATSAAIKFLESTRLAPSKEIVVVCLALKGDASQEEKAEWDKMANFYIEKDRYPVLTAPPNKQHPAGAKEIYLVPLRPTDTPPSMTDLIDGFELPRRREGAVWIGMLPVNRDYVGRYGHDNQPPPQHVRSGSASGTVGTPARPAAAPSADVAAPGVPPHMRSGGSGGGNQDWATPQKNELQALLGKINIPQIQSLQPPPLPTHSSTPMHAPPGGATPPFPPGPGGATPMPLPGRSANYAPPAGQSPLSQHGGPGGPGGYTPRHEGGQTPMGGGGYRPPHDAYGPGPGPGYGPGPRGPPGPPGPPLPPYGLPQHQSGPAFDPYAHGSRGPPPPQMGYGHPGQYAPSSGPGPGYGGGAYPPHGGDRQQYSGPDRYGHDGGDQRRDGPGAPYGQAPGLGQRGRFQPGSGDQGWGNRGR